MLLLSYRPFDILKRNAAQIQLEDSQMFLLPIEYYVANCH